MRRPNRARNGIVPRQAVTAGFNALYRGPWGNQNKLMRTDCCRQRIDDQVKAHMMFSYVQNECHRNHRPLRLGVYHGGDGYTGKWQDCLSFLADFQREIYA